MIKNYKKFLFKIIIWFLIILWINNLFATNLYLYSNYWNRYYDFDWNNNKIYFLTTEDNIENQNSYKPVLNNRANNLYVWDDKNWFLKIWNYYYIVDWEWIKQINNLNQKIKQVSIWASNPANTTLLKIWWNILMLFNSNYNSIDIANAWSSIFNFKNGIWWILFDQNLKILDSFSLNNVKLKAIHKDTLDNNVFLVVDDTSDSTKRYLLDLEYDPSWNYPLLNQVVEVNWNYSNEWIVSVWNIVYYLSYDIDNSKYKYIKFDKDLNYDSEWDISSVNWNILDWDVFNYLSWWIEYIWYINDSNELCNFANTSFSSSSCESVTFSNWWKVKKIFKDDNWNIWFYLEGWTFKNSALNLNLNNLYYLVYKVNWNNYYYFSKDNIQWIDVINNNNWNVTLWTYYFNNNINDWYSLITETLPWSEWCYYKTVPITTDWVIYWTTAYIDSLWVQQNINPTAWVPLSTTQWAFTDWYTWFSINRPWVLQYVMNKTTISPNWNIYD